MKISIIGGGGVVGSSAAFRIAQDGFASEIVLVDARPNMAEAHALDIEQSIARRAATRVRQGGLEDTKDSQVVLISVGAVNRTFNAARASRIDENIGMMIDLMEKLAPLSPSAVWMIATVPVDAIVYLIHRHFSIPRSKALGVNGNDTARLRWAIAKTLSVPATSIEAFVLGEHGDSLVPVFSQVKVNGKTVSLTQGQMDQIRTGISDFLKRWIELQPGRTAGWTTAECIGDVIKSMVLNDERVSACSTPLDGEYGFRGLGFGVPLRMDSKGVKEIVQFDLSPVEREALTASAGIIQEQIKRGEALFEKRKL
jgi:malate/lactate dehydrogenase